MKATLEGVCGPGREQRLFQWRISRRRTLTLDVPSAWWLPGWPAGCC